MRPRMAAIPGGDAPPETSKSQPATPLHSSTAPSNDGGTALRPLSQSAPQPALGDVHYRPAGRAPIRPSAVMLSPNQQAFVDKLDAKARLEKGVEQKTPVTPKTTLYP